MRKSTNMARQKTIYPTNEIAHLWAHQAVPVAYNPRRNFYFEGPTIFSYGSHFPIAMHVRNKRGQSAILLTEKTHSVTTAGHISMVRRAIPFPTSTCFNVWNPTDARPEVIRRDYEIRIERKRASLDAPKTRKTTKAQRLLELRSLIAEANRAAEFFGFDSFEPVPQADIDAALAVQAEYSAKLEETREARRIVQNARWEAQRERWAQEQTKRRLDQEQFCAMWESTLKDCWRNRQPFPDGVGMQGHALSFAYLRVSGNEIETTLGARVPAEHVRRALPFVLRLLASGQQWQRNGHTIHLGHYSLDRIDADGTVHAGCHRIPRAEVEYIAATLGVPHAA
jgi:hypothetical protein